MQYQLSESRIKRVLHTPHRIEEGIAPQTIAVMQNAGTIKHPKEIWVMLQEIKTKQNKKTKNFSGFISSKNSHYQRLALSWKNSHS